MLAAAKEVTRELGLGMRERIYQQALTIVLQERGIAVEREAPVRVRFRGRDLGEGYRIDLLVDSAVAVEVKSSPLMHPAFDTQLLTYMRGRRLALGYIVNFGMPTLAQGIRRKVRSDVLNRRRVVANRRVVAFWGRAIPSTGRHPLFPMISRISASDRDASSSAFSSLFASA